WDAGADVLSDDELRARPELSAFVAALRATGEGPAPTPSPALQALLTGGLGTSGADDAASPTQPPVLRELPKRQRHLASPGLAGLSGTESATLLELPKRQGRQSATLRELPKRQGRPAAARRWRTAARTGSGLGIAAKVVLVAGAAAASVTGAATIDGVPSAVQQPAQWVVSRVSDLFAPGGVPEPTGPTDAPTTRSATPAPTTTAVPAPADRAGTRAGGTGPTAVPNPAGAPGRATTPPSRRPATPAVPVPPRVTPAPPGKTGVRPGPPPTVPAPGGAGVPGGPAGDGRSGDAVSRAGTPLRPPVVETATRSTS
ncbi:MAG TPA: hypothetical protein VGK35_01625, partial [Actinotalea sp.]